MGGIPLLLGLALYLTRLEFSTDLLVGISIVTAVILGEYLAGTLVVLMLSGGQALEAYAVRRASSALALARRMPSQAHRKVNGAVTEIRLAGVAVGDLLVVFPHETCPVDAVVVEGAARRTNRTSPATERVRLVAADDPSPRVRQAVEELLPLIAAPQVGSDKSAAEDAPAAVVP